jgi:hypothetical protein
MNEEADERDAPDRDREGEQDPGRDEDTPAGR